MLIYEKERFRQEINADQKQGLFSTHFQLVLDCNKAIGGEYENNPDRLFSAKKSRLKNIKIQIKLIPTSLGTDWIENERFELVLAKMIIFTPKNGSKNSGNIGQLIIQSCFRVMACLGRI